jgi:hypothetical protein
MVAKTFLITLGFCPNAAFKPTAQRLKESLSGKHNIDLIFVAKPYPIDTEKNLELNIATALEAGYRVVEKAVDKGAAGDFNETVDSLNIDDNDIVIIYDHDIYPIHNEWDDAMIRVMQGAPNCGWLALWNEATNGEFLATPGIEHSVDGICFTEAKTWMMIGASAFRGSFLKATGGLVQPGKYYGGVEKAMYPHLEQCGMYLAFLNDFAEDQRIKLSTECEKYRAWKMVHSLKAFQFSFDEWLKIQI